MAKAAPPSTARICTSGISPGASFHRGAAGHLDVDDARGMAMAFAREGSGRVALSLSARGLFAGEWHEAINLWSVGRLRRSSAFENIRRRCRHRSRISRPRGCSPRRRGLRDPGPYPRCTVPISLRRRCMGGRAGARRCRPDADRARVVRMCGHDHHDDMLYLGRDHHPSWEYPRERTG